MNEFFKSEMVRGEMQEMAELQQFCVRSINMFPALSPEKKLDYFVKLKQLIEKQQIFYARLKLSDDPDAKMLLQNLAQAALMFGAEPNDDINQMFKSQLQKIDVMKSKAEADVG